MNGLCGPSAASSIPGLQERTNSAGTGTGSPIRKGVIAAQYTLPESMRKSRSQGGKKLQKCLSTASYGEELSFSRPQMTPLSHNLLMTRQYCSFGSTTSQIKISFTSTPYFYFINLCEKKNNNYHLVPLPSPMNKTHMSHGNTHILHTSPHQY